MDQLIKQPVQEIIFSPVRPVRFRFPDDGRLPLTVNRREVAAIAEALCRLAGDPKIAEGVRVLAEALGIEATNEP